VVVGLTGGLGNQMFQYAAGRSLALRLGTQLSLDISWFLCRKERQFALDKLSIQADIHASRLRMPDLVKSLESRISRKWAKKRMGLEIHREPHFHFCPKVLAVKHPVYLEGYWQSERYFDFCRDVIASDFALQEKLPEKCRSMLEQIQAADAIGIHVRRGDYVSDPATTRVHGPCSPDYYRISLEMVATGLDQPHGFVFSDDVEWVRNHFCAPFPITVVDVNRAKEAYWDLHLMAACRHFVIANSSFSWWAAWLGRRPGKRVVAPRRWFQKEDLNTSDLIPADWMRI